MARNCTLSTSPEVRAKSARAALMWAVFSFFIACLAGCGGGEPSDVGIIVDDAIGGDDSEVIGAAGNPDAVFADIAGNSNVSATINLDTLDAETTDLTVVMPEDNRLSLVLVPDPLGEAAEIVSFPEFGAALLIDGVLQYTPNANFFGRDLVRFERGSVGFTLEIIVSGVNDAPAIVGDVSRLAEQSVEYSSQLNVRNLDRDVLEFSSNNLPTWLTLDEQTGELSGTPERQDVGLHEGIQFFVRDNGGLSDSLLNVVIEVLDLNDAPFLNTSQFPDQMDARESRIVSVFPDDLDGDTIFLEVEPNEFVDTFVSGGTVTVTAQDVTDVTEINLVLIATDQLGRVSREVLPLTLFPLTDSGRGRTLQGRKLGSGIHLVLLGDGYQEDQQQSFREDVESLIETMADDPAVALHFEAWNIHMIETVSVDSGIDDNVSFDVRDTAYDSGYFCLSIPRLICADNIALFNAALDEYPNVDELVMIANDSRYGGSGGSVAVASSSAPEIALHELGHSFAGLADEYVDNDIPALGTNNFQEGFFPNVTRIQDPELVPWRNWIDLNNATPSENLDEGVGVFQGGFYDASAFFRPTFNSRMRTFDRPFGPVGGEAWALSVYREMNPVASFSPRENQVIVGSGGLVQFSVDPIFGPSVQRLDWVLDGEILADKENETELTLRLRPGAHALTVRVTDITGAIRAPTPNAAQFVWRWDITVQ